MVENWSKADKINMFLAIIALFSALTPVGKHIWEDRHRPRATIGDPANDSRPAHQDFGASGTAKNIRLGSDLWLIVRPGVEGRFYPIGRIFTRKGESWVVPKGVIKPASGPQELQIYLIPIVDAGQLLDYVKKRNKDGDDPGISALPSSALLLTYSRVIVPKGE